MVTSVTIIVGYEYIILLSIKYQQTSDSVISFYDLNTIRIWFFIAADDKVYDILLNIQRKQAGDSYELSNPL